MKVFWLILAPIQILYNLANYFIDTLIMDRSSVEETNEEEKPTWKND
jgi:hypothetical protein